MKTLDKRKLWPIMIVDFLFWSATAGLGPLISRLIQQRADAAIQNELIAHTVLIFTLGSITGRLVAGRWEGSSRSMMQLGTIAAGLALICYFSPHPSLWLLGQGIQGVSLGVYSVSVLNLTSNLIPAGKRMQGFALIGMADFLGFASGPVISGISLQAFGFEKTFTFFMVLMSFAFIVTQKITKLESLPEEAPSSVAPLKKGRWRTFAWFIPLQMAMFSGLLFHIFYSRYLPIIYETGRVAIESLFFTGYILGGIGFRMGLVQKMETMRGRTIFLTGQVLLALTAFGVGLFPWIENGLPIFAVLAGLFYGLGFEAIYIFTLSWIAAHTSRRMRGRVIAFVFLGFDGGSLLAGFTFGPLADLWTPTGLFWRMLIFIPLSLMLPLFLHKPDTDGAGASPG